MGLSLENIYRRPFGGQNSRNNVKQKTENEKSAQTQRENQTGGDSKSKGLQYIETENKPPIYSKTDSRFAMPAASAYNSVSINNPAYKNQLEKTQPQSIQSSLEKKRLDSQINIAQILKDFKNTAIAIGTPQDLMDEVNGYVSLIDSQVKKDNPNVRLVKSNLKNAALILDNHITQTLGRDSNVVEKWVDTLFLQNINFHYDENEINERFLVKFPENDENKTARKEELETTGQQAQVIQSENENIIPITVASSVQNLAIPQDKQLKSLFIQAKKYAYSNDPENAIRYFEQALNRANELDDTETSGKIYYEVGKIYDDHDYLAQALKSYNQALKLSNDENVKTKAHYSMAQIYDDVNQITPALDHYISTVSHAGEAENLPAQSASLTKVGNIYTDLYDKEAFEFYEVAQNLAEETENYNLRGFVYSNSGKSYRKFDEPQKSLKSYSNAVRNYEKGESPAKTAQNYLAAADIMVEFNNIYKAQNLLKKAQKYARQTDNVNLMNEINTKIDQLEELKRA